MTRARDNADLGDSFGVLGSGVTGGSGLTLSGPVGMIASFGMASAPTGWIICDGAAVSRTVTYDALFAVIGTTWGTGDGSSTFNLPDLKGAFLRGVGTSTGFTQDHTTTLAAFEDDAVGTHEHSLSRRHDSGSSNWPARGGGTVEAYYTQGFYSGRTANETRPNNVGVTYCIKY